MVPFIDFDDAWNGIFDYFDSEEGRALPEEHRAKLRGFLKDNAVAFAIACTGHYIYAHSRQTELPQGLLALGARCAAWASDQHVDDMGGPRGVGIAKALMRDSGEPEGLWPWPDRKDDPEPRAEFMPPVEPPEAPDLPEAPKAA